MSGASSNAVGWYLRLETATCGPDKQSNGLDLAEIIRTWTGTARAPVDACW
jgi:hypothetical protein